MPNITENPNRLFNVCLKQAAIAERHTATAMQNRQQARRAIYRLAAAHQSLVSQHAAWFQAQAEAVGGIDALLEAWYRPLVFFGEDWRALLHDVAEGMTEGDYMKATAGSFVRRQKVAKLAIVQATESPLPIEPPKTLHLEERVVLLEEQNRTLRAQLLAARKQVADLRRLVAQQERRIGELETVLNRVERVTQRRKVS